MVWEDILKFHRHFKIPHQRLPSFPDNEMCEFRIKFLEEEVDEFAQAVREKDLVKAFDALIDIVYVAVGTAVIFNFPFMVGWEVVHSANMRKINKPSNKEGRHQYDIVKPVGWISPEKKLQSILLDYEYDCLLDQNNHLANLKVKEDE